MNILECIMYEVYFFVVILLRGVSISSKIWRTHMNEKKLIITKKGKLKEINKDDKMVQTFLTVVADRNRMKIIRLLRGQILTATQINLKLKLSQNLTSYHISKLKKISFLKERKEGTFRFYTVNLPKIREYNKLFRKQLGI